jgi:hypothetical protein
VYTKLVILNRAPLGSKAWSNSIRTDAVRLTVLNLSWSLTNPLRSRPLVCGFTYSSGFYVGGNNPHTPFLVSLKVAASHWILSFPHLQSFTFPGVRDSGEEQKAQCRKTGMHHQIFPVRNQLSAIYTSSELLRYQIIRGCIVCWVVAYIWSVVVAMVYRVILVDP